MRKRRAMSFLMYQRSDPRNSNWIPLITQQLRLRNVVQIVALNLVANDDTTEVYFTLHITAMSAPFFTSERTKYGDIVQWKEFQARELADYATLSLPGVIIKIWDASDLNKVLLSWGVVFKGLHYLGSKTDPPLAEFKNNTIVFKTPYGLFTSLRCCISPASNLVCQLYPAPASDIRSSYRVKDLADLHRIQRDVIEEVSHGRNLKLKVGLQGFRIQSSQRSWKNVSDPGEKNVTDFYSLNGKALQRFIHGEKKLDLLRKVESKRLEIKTLQEEKIRIEERIDTIKNDAQKICDIRKDLKQKTSSLSKDCDFLSEVRLKIYGKRKMLKKLISTCFLRKRQLISELLIIYPIKLVQGSQKYSINGVQLPNAEDYGNEGSGQISVALGYTAHLIAMICFFLDIPPRYPILHFGSRSRIVDNVTDNIPDKEREFPLYYKGKKDIYCAYAIYLLNKNISQIRWYCGLPTPDLRATLPNLYHLLSSRLIVANWPPPPDDVLEIGQELTEEVDRLLCKSDRTRSLEEGLDNLHRKQYDSFQAYLGSSYAGLEHAGSNTVLNSEMRHSKAQNKFLCLWKEKKYVEKDDVDPKMLANFLDPESRFSRKISCTCLRSSSQTHVNEIQGSNNTFSNAVLCSKHPDIRKYEPSENFSLDVEAANCKMLSRSNHSSTGIVEIENRIKEAERRRSFCENRPPSTIKYAPDGDFSSLSRPGGFVDAEYDESEDDRARELNPYHACPSAGDLETNHNQSFNDDSTFHIQAPDASTSETIQVLARIDTDAGNELSVVNNEVTASTPQVEPKSIDVFSKSEPLSSNLERQGNWECSKNVNDDNQIDVISNNEDLDLSLVARTEALLHSTSFNLVRRKLSGSN